MFAAFISVNVNTDDVSKLMKLKGVTKDKAAQMIKERKKQHFEDWSDLKSRVVGICGEQDGLVIEF